MELNTVYHGNCLDILKTFEDNSIDSVVTDPPYGISFMAKGWDTFSGNKEYAKWCEDWAKECLRVLKPGGYLLAFSGTRTYHALAWGVESAGFEIRDMIEWLYTSGFPKNTDIGKQFDKKAGATREIVGVKAGHEEFAQRTTTGHLAFKGSTEGFDRPWMHDDHKRALYHMQTAPSTDLAKQWDGWGTALKPAHESIVVARKPFTGTVCANVEQYGTGAINVDGCRIGDEEITTQGGDKFKGGGIYNKYATCIETKHTGRFPANCVTTESDEWYSPYFNVTPQEVSKKASKKDRNSDWEGNPIVGEEKFAPKGNYEGRDMENPKNHLGGMQGSKSVNNHPTVKPIALMEWLIKLVTQKNGLVLDPFAGSGSTLVAAKRNDFKYIGIEREEEYVNLINSRLGTGTE